MRPLEDAARAAVRGRLAGRHERDPRRHDADRRVAQAPLSLGRVQTPTLALVVRRDLEIAALRARGLLAGAGALRDREAAPATPASGSADRRTACTTAARGRAHRRRRARRRRLVVVGGAQAGRRAAAAPVRPDGPPARRQHPLRLHRRPHAARRAGLYEQHKVITYPRTSSRYLSRDLVSSLQARSPRTSARPTPDVRGARRLRGRARRAAARAHRERREGQRPPRDHPDRGRATRCRRLSRDERRIYDLVARALPRRLPPGGRSEPTTVVDGGRRASASARAARC